MVDYVALTDESLTEQKSPFDWSQGSRLDTAINRTSSTVPFLPPLTPHSGRVPASAVEEGKGIVAGSVVAMRCEPMFQERACCTRC